LDVGAYDLDQTSLNVSGRPMAPHGTVTTSSASAGQKTTGRKSKAIGPTPHQIIQKSHQIPNTLSGFSDSGVGSTREILYRITDYFDSADGTNGSVEYWYRLDNNFADSSPNIPQASYQKIHSVELYALPRFSVDTAASPVVVLFGVPIMSSVTGTSRNSAQRSTLLTPSSVSTWQKVGGWSASVLLSDTQQSLSVQSNTGGFDFACLAACTVVDPDDYTAITDNGVQFKMVISVRQTLPLEQTANISVVRTVDPSWGSPTGPGTTEAASLQIEARNITNVV